MKCKKCNSKLRLVNIKIEGAKHAIKSYQCTKCEYFKLDKKNQPKILKELKEQDFKISQKITKLSKNRLGIYLNKYVINSLKLKAGEEISVSVPDREHIVISLEN